MPDKNKLSVIIPAFSGLEQLTHCLQALIHGNFHNFKIIVVDHGMTDAITNGLTAQFPEVFCLRGSPELWWTGATNLGIRNALRNGSDAVMLLNHDCYVQADTIVKLLRHAEGNPGCIIAPTQYDTRTKREIIGATSIFPLGFPTIIPPVWWYRYFYSSTLVPTRLITGGRGVVIPVSIFHEVGYFDEKRLPHYYADHDFYYRCVKAGVRLFVCTDAKVYVDDEMSSSANKIDNLSFAGFRESLISRGSHRNLRDLYTLFSRHCSLRIFAAIGVALNLARYSTVYLFKYFGRKISVACFLHR
jgi:GT2 family glycosyltransferase